ncbi:MAG: ROK family protein [Chthonomonas sp.]|nr:ROK family protein [Chthonomonas sp.]
MRTVVGVDLGGTNVRAQVLDEAGNPQGERQEIPSRAQEGTEAIIEALNEVIEQAINDTDTTPERVGLAIPGFVDDVSGMVFWAPNFGHYEGSVFKYWKDVPVGAMLRERLSIPVCMGNDANLAALGEYRFGSGENRAKCLVMLTLGTGVGGGIVMGPGSVQGDARGPIVLLGGNKGGAECGHLSLNPSGLDCPAGSYGSLEAYCQRDSIIRRAQHRLNRGRDSVLHQLTGGDLNLVSPSLISKACEAGDELAIEVFEEVGTFLGQGIGSFINIFAPDVVAVGGQIAKAGEFILGPARRAARNVAIPNLFDFATIVQAKEIDDAGILGAAALALI